MLNAVPELYSRREPYNVREKDSDAVRINFAAHLVSEPFARLCAVSNPIRRIKRPEFIAHREFAPIECLPDDCLLQGWAADLPWQSGMPATALETSSEPMAPARVAAQRACVALRE